MYKSTATQKTYHYPKQTKKAVAKKYLVPLHIYSYFINEKNVVVIRCLKKNQYSSVAEMALDPAEQHLRHVEKDVLIPKIMREKARERCSEQVEDFTKCCKDSGILMVVKCRKENTALKECLTAYYNDPAFYEECKMEYLKEREEFRKTGIPTKRRLQKLPTSM